MEWYNISAWHEIITTSILLSLLRNGDGMGTVVLRYKQGLRTLFFIRFINVRSTNIPQFLVDLIFNQTKNHFFLSHTTLQCYSAVVSYKYKWLPGLGCRSNISTRQAIQGRSGYAHFVSEFTDTLLLLCYVILLNTIV